MTLQSVVMPDRASTKNKIHHEIVEIFLQRLSDRGFLSQHMKILDAIEKTAQLTGICPINVAFVLVENGLRAGRKAFPQIFLDHVDNVFFGNHSGQHILASAVYAALKDSWVIEQRIPANIIETMDNQKDCVTI